MATCQEGTMRIVKAYKARFPSWSTERTDTKRFVTQYIELIQAETAVLHDNDGIMVDEERYILEMQKPERGGLSSKQAAIKFAAALEDPTTVQDTKNGQRRIRLDLDDHVRFQNKFSRLKQLIDAEAAKKGVSSEDKAAMASKIMADHDRAVAGQDIDLVSMAQRMTKGAGRGASAFDANMLQIGELTDLLVNKSSSAAADQKGHKNKDKDKGKGDGEDAEDDGQDDEDDDEGDGSRPGSASKKWIDMDRAISKASRAFTNYHMDITDKLQKAWKALREAEFDPKTQALAEKVQHEIDVARGRRRAIGFLLSYPKDSDEEELEGFYFSVADHRVIEQLFTSRSVEHATLKVLNNFKIANP